MEDIWKSVAPVLAVALLGTGLLAQTTSAARYDNTIQTKVAQKLAEKKEFLKLKASSEDGIVTLSGRVEVYQQKLDAAKKVRKIANVQRVRNLIAVSTAVPTLN
jgi:osmotically-inducible protein OsmY